jgi:hypothetical protein
MGLAAGRKGHERAEPERVRPHPGAWDPPVDGFYQNAFHPIRQAYSEAHQKNVMPTSPFIDAENILAHEFHADDRAGGQGLEVVEPELAAE